MKQLLTTLALIFSVAAAGAQTVTMSSEVDSDTHVFSPEEEAEFYMNDLLNFGRAARFRFAQTKWNECADEITGQYSGYNCARSRGISVILKKFIDNHFYTCVDKGLAAQGGGTVNELHIVHAGILGDPNHSPRSLHAENRAIDVKRFEMKLTNGQVKNFTYAGTGNRAFFTAFRKCWGDIVRKHNGCPLYKNSSLLTGSIGWEDKNHQQHMHTSVPYCVNGKYGSGFFQK